MSDNQRVRFGVGQRVVSQSVASAEVIRLGDMVAQDATTGLPEPASKTAIAGPGDAAAILAAQQAFKDEFLGIAAQRSLDGETQAIRCVAECQDAVYPCDPATFKLGALLGPAPDSGAPPTFLEPQKLVEVADITAAIARCSRAEPSAVTEVHARFFSGVMLGGPQAD